MTFIYADELKQKFEVFGHFYDLKIKEQNFKCRSTLEIMSKSNPEGSEGIPDAVVIMMNPGSSKPQNNEYVPKTYTPNEIFKNEWEKEIIPTKPDNAQYQIMRLMLLNNWEHVKILNLSDLRNGNSGEFSKEFENANKIDTANPHCITHENRRNELTSELKIKPNGIYIAAWGSVEVLRKSAYKLIEIESKIVGIELDKPWYKYASPYKKDQKIEWLNKINNKVNKHNK